MDRRLTTEDIDWLRKMRDAKTADQPSSGVPANIARRLTMLGCAKAIGPGAHSITLRGRDELVDRELENEIR